LRIALTSEGTRGDIEPLLELAERFRERGHEAFLCASPDFAKDAAARQLEFHAIGSSIREFMTEHAESLARGGVALLRSTRKYLATTLAAQFEQLPEAIRGADLIIGAGVQAAAASTAELFGIPYRYVAYCPSLLPSPEHPPVFLPLSRSTPWLNRRLWSLSRIAFNLGMRPALNRQRRALGLPPVSDLLDHLLSARPVIAADPLLVTLPSHCALPFDQIPCLHAFDPHPLPAKLEAFLDSGPPPVYLGFGSMTDPDPAATTRILLDAVSKAGCRALISEGWAGLGAGAFPEGVMQLGTVSHPALFRRVAAVVHHGGAGTTTTAARAGVPQILVPHVLDQHYWAQRVQRLGIGAPPIRLSRLTADLLGDTIAATLDNELIAEHAQELGGRLREGLGADPTAAFLAHEGASGSSDPAFPDP
jgi:vancomycin aglycone glucosyltransferase